MNPTCQEDIQRIGMAAAVETAKDLVARGYDAVANGLDVIVRHKGLTYRLHNTIIDTGTNTREELHEAFAHAVAQRIISG